MKETLFADFADSVADRVSSSLTIQEWPECRRVCLERLSADPPRILALPLLSCQAVGGSPIDAIPITAAWAMLRYAADLFDAVQDGDDLPNGVSNQLVAIDYASGLIFAAFDLIASIQDPKVVQRVTALFSQAAFHASLGQHISQQSKGMDDITLEDYWHTTIMKSGSIFRAGLGGGAIAGNAPDHYVKALGDFGNALGVIRQVIDDCRDVLEESGPIAYEVTLPLLLLATKRDEPIVELIERFNSRDALSTVLDISGVPEIITSVLMEWSRRAREHLLVLKRTDKLADLEAILQDFITKPWLNLPNE